MFHYGLSGPRAQLSNQIAAARALRQLYYLLIKILLQVKQVLNHLV